MVEFVEGARQFNAFCHGDYSYCSMGTGAGSKKDKCSLNILFRQLPIIQGVDDPVWGFFMPLASPPFYCLPFGHITDQISMSLRG